MWLDRETGAKCYMLSARALCIIWGDTPRYWRWIPSPVPGLLLLHMVLAFLFHVLKMDTSRSSNQHVLLT
jgi:hypothetical protein